jgi:hypothetical protein
MMLPILVAGRPFEADGKRFALLSFGGALIAQDQEFRTI